MSDSFILHNGKFSFDFWLEIKDYLLAIINLLLAIIMFYFYLNSDF